MRIMLIGGAGYIGSSIAHHLLDRGHEPGVFDNLSTGSRDAIPQGVFFVAADCGDASALAAALKDFRADAVIQLAAAVRVEESVSNPAKYYFNNTNKSLTVFDTCAKAGIKDIVFSSTAAVYGEPNTMLIDEQVPENAARVMVRHRVAERNQATTACPCSKVRGTEVIASQTLPLRLLQSTSAGIQARVRGASMAVAIACNAAASTCE